MKEISDIMVKSKRISPVVSKSAETIGGYISAWRRIQRISQAELAARAGVGREVISRLENGDTSVGLGKVLSICRVLGILSQVEEAFDPASTEYGRLQLVQGLPERVRK